jgi:hypothetical protein
MSSGDRQDTDSERQREACDGRWHGIRQRTHDQSALSFIDHDPVFVVN